MGYIRLALALAVLFGHFGATWNILPASNAVQAFYLISGFYMFLILDTKYVDATTFYINRALRLYPSYIFILVCSIVAAATLGATAPYLSASELTDRFAKMNVPSALFLVFTNLTILFQDWVLFLHIDGGQSLAWTPEFYKEAYPAYQMLIVPQAWSLGVEITFYLLAPILTRLRSRIIILFVVVSFAARTYTYFQGLPYFLDPWNYRFFPFEVAVFLVGGLMYRVSKRLPQQIANPYIANVLIAITLVYCAIYARLPDRHYEMFVYKDDIFMVLLASSLPFIYSGRREARLSKVLGEWSYPLYINHLFVSSLIAVLMPAWMGNYMFFVAGITGSICLAAIMTRFIEEPVDRLRQRIARRNDHERTLLPYHARRTVNAGPKI